MVESGSVLDGVIIEGKPLVSVKVITYNHGKYIRQCLDGILMQVVNFPYEIIVHDDASPDDTADIIREYAAKYPTVIKPIFQTENQYSQGRSFAKLIYERLQGKYIAQCEGDDYWTDPGKLQTQVDFLEEHPEYIGTAHNVNTIDEYGNHVSDKINPYPIYKAHEFTVDDAAHLRLPGQSASIVYRNIYLDMGSSTMQKYIDCKGNGDQKLSLLLTLYGIIWCFEDIMVDHRKITAFGDSWSARTYRKNLGLFNYTMVKNRASFARECFNYKLDVNESLISIYISSVKWLLLHPNKENLDIFISIDGMFRADIDNTIVGYLSIMQECIRRIIGLFCVLY